MRLSVAMVGILSENDDLRIGKARVVQSIKDRIHIGVHTTCTVLLDKECSQLTIVGLRHLVCKEFLPIVLENCLCHAKLSRKLQIYSLLLRGSSS